MGDEPPSRDSARIRLNISPNSAARTGENSAIFSSPASWANCTSVKSTSENTIVRMSDPLERAVCQLFILVHGSDAVNTAQAYMCYTYLTGASNGASSIDTINKS